MEFETEILDAFDKIKKKHSRIIYYDDIKEFINPLIKTRKYFNTNEDTSIGIYHNSIIKYEIKFNNNKETLILSVNNKRNKNNKIYIDPKSIYFLSNKIIIIYYKEILDYTIYVTDDNFEFKEKDINKIKLLKYI